MKGSTANANRVAPASHNLSETPLCRGFGSLDDSKILSRFSLRSLGEAAGFTARVADSSANMPPAVGHTIPKTAPTTAPELSATAAQALEKLAERDLPLPDLKRLKTAWAKARSRAEEEALKDGQVDKAALLQDLGDFLFLGHTKATILCEKLDSGNLNWGHLGKGLTPDQRKLTRKLFDRMWVATSSHWEAVKRLWKEAASMSSKWKVNTPPIFDLVLLLQLDVAEESTVLNNLVFVTKGRSKKEALTKVEKKGEREEQHDQAVKDQREYMRTRS